MPKLKLIYDNETDVPEAHLELFEERDGKWHFAGVEGLQTNENVKRLETALKAERDAHRKTKEQAKKLEKIGDRDVDQLLKDAEEAPDLREELEELKKGGAGKDVQAQIDAALERERKRLQREIDKEKAETAKVQKQLEEERAGKEKLTTKMRSTTVRGELTKAASAAGMRKEAVDDVLRYQDVFEVVEGEDGNDKVVTRDGVGVTPGISPADWMADRKNDRPHWWPDSEGGGLRGGDKKNPGVDNPFKKEGFNFTKATTLIARDRTKADQLARTAGFADAESAVRELGKKAKAS